MELQKARKAHGNFDFSIGDEKGSGTFKLVYNNKHHVALGVAESAAWAAYLGAQGEADNDKAWTAYMKARYTTLCNRLVTWDVKDNGVPVPVTPEGMLAAQIDDEVIEACYKGMATAKNPK